MKKIVSLNSIVILLLIFTSTIYADTAKTHLKRGKTYFESNKYDEAIKEYREAIELNYNLVEAHRELIRGYDKKDKLNKVVLEYQKMVKEKPQDAIARYGLGYAYIHKGEDFYDKAIEELKRAIKINPKMKYAHNSLGWIYKERKEYDEAVREFQSALAIDPNFVLSHYNLGRIYYDRKQYDNAIEKYKRAIESKPNYASAHYGLGLCYYYQDRYDEAIKAYQGFLEISPKSKYSDDALMAIGESYEFKGDYKRALANYQELIKRYPDSNRSYDAELKVDIITKGNDYGGEPLRLYTNEYKHWKKREYDLALEDCQKLLKEYPKSYLAPEIQYYIGYIYHFNLEEYPKAIEAYLKLIEGYPLSKRVPQTQYRVGRCHYNLDEYNLAIDAFQKVIDNYPESEWARHALRWIASSYKKLGETTKQIATLREYINKYPQSKDVSWIQMRIAICYFEKLKDIDQAIREYQRVIDNYPESEDAPLAQFFLGYSYLSQGNIEKAGREFQKVIDNYPESDSANAVRNLMLPKFQTIETLAPPSFQNVLQKISPYLLRFIPSFLMPILLPLSLLLGPILIVGFFFLAIFLIRRKRKEELEARYGHIKCRLKDAFIIFLLFVTVSNGVAIPLKGNLLYSYLIGGLVFIFLPFWYILRKYRQKIKALGFKLLSLPRTLRWSLGGAVAIIGLAQIGQTLTEWITGQKIILRDTPFGQIVASAESAKELLLVIIVIAVFAPIVEEIFFRGFAYPALKKKVGLKWGIIFSAFFFAFIHLGPLPAFISLTIVGIGLAYLYERTNSLIPSMIVHLINNLLVTFLVFFHLVE